MQVTIPKSRMRKQLREGDTLLQSVVRRYALPYLPAEELEVDLSFASDPWRVSREQVLVEILLPASREGWIPESPDDLRAWARKTPLLEVRTLAAEVLRAHPWPPGFRLPTFAEFVSSDEYLGGPDGRSPLSERQKWVVNESIGPSAQEWFVEPRKVDLLILTWGKGAGKDMICSEIQAYVCWTVCQMRNPWFHFQMVAGDPLDVLNVAQDSSAARENFFKRVLFNFGRPCFATVLDRDRDITADSVTFRRKLPGSSQLVEVVKLRSMHSLARGVEGKNTFFFVMDEADAFQDLEGHDKGREMLTSLTTSNRSVQIGVVISWPRSESGLMFELLDQCGNLDRPGGEPKAEYWGDIAATGEVLPFKVWVPDQYASDGTVPEGTVWRNPLSGWDSTMPGSIVDKIMWSTWRTDRPRFDAVYACRPMATEGAWLTMPHLADEAMRPDLEPVAVARSYVSRRNDQGAVKEFVALTLEGLQMRRGVTYQIGGDFGLDDASLAICVAHAVPPREEGCCSPEAFAEDERRLSKHYRAVPLPVDAFGHPLRDDAGALLFPELAGWRPEDWRCEWTGRVPDPRADSFWGVCPPSGKRVQRPVIERFTQDGEPVYRKGQDGNPVVEEAFLPLVVEDLILEWRPDVPNRRPVDLLSVRDALLVLKEGGRVGAFVADQWQAEYMLQELAAAGLRCDAKAMTAPEQWRLYENMRSLLDANLYEMLPCDSPKAEGRGCGTCVPCRASRQLKELIRKHNRIEKPEYSRGGGKGRKDLTDAKAIAVDLCVQAGRTARVNVHRRDEGAAQMRRQGQAKRAHKATLVQQVLGEAGIRSKR